MAGNVAGGNLSLDDFTTLRHVLDFLMGATPALTASSNGAPADELLATDHATGENGIPANGVDPAVAASAEAAESTQADFAQAIRLEGTPYDIGWQQGQQFKAEIRRILRHYADCVGDQLDDLPGQASRFAPERCFSADELDELQGLADAVEVPLGNLLAHQLTLMAELGIGAGQMASQVGGAGGARRWIHALRQPAPLVGALRAVAQPVIFARRPTGEIPHLAVSYLGCVGILGGLNAAGVAITATSTRRANVAGKWFLAVDITRLWASSCRRRLPLHGRRCLKHAGAYGFGIGHQPEAGNGTGRNASRPRRAGLDGLGHLHGSDEAVVIEFDGRELRRAIVSPDARRG